MLVDYSNEESGDQSVDVKPQLFPSEKRLLQGAEVFPLLLLRSFSSSEKG